MSNYRIVAREDFSDVTYLLEIEHPVMLAGMGGVSYAPLVAAVSEAGGFGCRGASTMTHERMVEEMAAVRAATAKPFGVDLLTAAPQDFEAKVNDIADAGATVYVAGLGVPREAIRRYLGLHGAAQVSQFLGVPGYGGMFAALGWLLRCLQVLEHHGLWL